MSKSYSDEKLRAIVELSGFSNENPEGIIENLFLRKFSLLCPFCNEEEGEKRTWGEKTMVFDWENHEFSCGECGVEATPYEVLLSVGDFANTFKKNLEGFARILPLLIPKGYSERLEKAGEEAKE